MPQYSSAMCGPSAHDPGRGALAIIRPETVIRWHRLGFRAYWRWRSGNRVGRPKGPVELRALIREMSQANPLWGAPRIHGEPLKLGSPSRDRRQVHGATARAAIASLEDLPAQPRPAHRRDGSVCRADRRLQVALWPGDHPAQRRHLVWINVTTNPTADWIARQINRSLPLGAGAPIPDPRQRRLLRSARNTTPRGHGHPRSTNPARMSGPCRDFGSGVPAPDPGQLRELPQR